MLRFSVSIHGLFFAYAKTELALLPWHYSHTYTSKPAPASQNQGMDEVGGDLQKLTSPNPLLKPGSTTTGSLGPHRVLSISTAKRLHSLSCQLVPTFDNSR